MKKKFEHKEDFVAKALGLTREYVAELRQENLMVDEDVAVVSGYIRYSDAGIRKLTDILGLQQKTGEQKKDDGRPTTDDKPRSDAATDVLKGVERQEARTESLAGMGPNSEKNAPTGTPSAAKEALHGTLDAVVSRVYGNNHQYMEATLGDQTIVIRVRDNKHFVPGMTVESRWLTRVNERVFDFVGRCPRGRGKW